MLSYKLTQQCFKYLKYYIRKKNNSFLVTRKLLSQNLNENIFK